MSTLGLFALGVAVSAITFLALGLLIAGAILDGRDERARKTAEGAQAAPAVSLAPAPVIRMPNREGEAA